jgi:hypothetical protein
MATKLNSEFNYRFLVQGETIWEKIKTLQGFLVGRKRAAVLEEVSVKKLQAKISKLKWLKETTKLEYEILEMEAEIIEAESFLDDQAQCFILNTEEIIMLERLIAEAYVIAEPTRIDGYTDEQMFEANAANEFTAVLAREMYAEILSQGRPSPAKLHNAMSNPITFKALKEAGLIPTDATLPVPSNNPLLISVKGIPELLEGKIN